MNKHRDFVCRRHNNERGQIVPLVGVIMVGMLGMTAMSVDVGSAYFSYNQLQAATNAAALAGAYGLPNTGAATTEATSLSAVTGNNNAQSNLPNVTMVSGYPQYYCASSISVTCIGTTPVNAIVVKQQVTIPTYFARVFGKNSVTLTTTATAAMRGSTASPYNVAIILDTTASMNTSDTNGNCTGTRISCAMKGVEVLLQNLSPCGAGLTSCGTVTNGNVPNSVDRVSLLAFPNVTVGTASNDYNCGSANPAIPVYSFPSATATSYAPTGSSTATYQILNFQSDYRTSDTASSLNLSSNLSLAANAKTGCPGMKSPGGDGTFYAGVIYAAQSALVAEKAANTGSQNVLIILSDGDATAAQAKMAAGATNTGTYPSWVNECQQAITAAQAVTTAGTRVYSVAYGAPSSGCTTDTSGPLAGLSPCQTMEKMASAPQYFFSDSSSCHIAGSQPTTNLNTIFTSIAGDLTVARLIPNGTT